MSEADYEAEYAKLLKLLRWLRYDMHRVYGNTSYRGRGIGGQTLTAQCHVLDPLPKEQEQLDEIDHIIYDPENRRFL